MHQFLKEERRRVTEKKPAGFAREAPCPMARSFGFASG
jgi:hypothetical protein